LAFGGADGVGGGFTFGFVDDYGKTLGECCGGFGRAVGGGFPGVFEGDLACLLSAVDA